jgi:hypothetical protein
MKEELGSGATKLASGMLKAMMQVRMTEGSRVSCFKSGGDSVVASREGLIRSVLQGTIVVSLGASRSVKILVDGVEGVKRSSEQKDTPKVQFMQAVAEPSKITQMVGVVTQGKRFSGCRALIDNHREGRTER